MPITKDRVVKDLTDQGLDPSSFDLDALVNNYNQQETADASVQPTNKSLSRGEAAGAVFKRSIVPGLAGVAGGAAGLAAGGAVAPTTGLLAPIVPLVGTGVGAVAGSALGSYGQEKYLQATQSPKEYEQGVNRLQEAEKQYPIQSGVINTLPMLLQGRPSISGFKQLGTGLAGLATKRALEVGEKGALTSAAANIGMGAGQDIASQLLFNKDQPYSPASTLEAAGTGLLFNKPSLLGKTRLFGYHGEQDTQPSNKSIQGDTADRTTPPPVPELQGPNIPQEGEERFIGPPRPPYGQPELPLTSTTGQLQLPFEQQNRFKPTLPLSESPAREKPLTQADIRPAIEEFPSGKKETVPSTQDDLQRQLNEVVQVSEDSRLPLPVRMRANQEIANIQKKIKQLSLVKPLQIVESNPVKPILTAPESGTKKIVETKGFFGPEQPLQTSLEKANQVKLQEKGVSEKVYPTNKLKEPQYSKEPTTFNPSTGELKQGEYVAGANNLRAMDIFGAGMYDKKPGETIAKEAIQNASDSFNSEQKDKKISIGRTSDNSFYVSDNGKGMTPTEVITKFLPAFESGKEGERSRGSFGLAKIALLGSPKSWSIETVTNANGRNLRTRIEGTPEQWKDFVSKGLKIDFDINSPGQYNIHGMPFSIDVVPRDYSTGTIYKATLDSSTEAYTAHHAAEKTLASLQDNFDVSSSYLYGAESKSISLDSAHSQELTNKEFLKSYTQSKDLKPLESSSVEGANIIIKALPGNESKRVYRIPIFNRGLLQFELPFYEDIQLPKGIAIDISPTTDVKDSNYPYTPNRDSLKGAAKTEVEGILRKFGDIVKQRQIEQFVNFKENAIKIEGTHTKYLDFSNRLPEDVKRAIVSSKSIQILSRIVKPMVSDMLDYLNSRVKSQLNVPLFDAKFSGFASGGGFYGVRFGEKALGSKGEIYFDPFLIAKKVDQTIQEGGYTADEFGMAYAESLLGTTVHEIAHQISHSEGEEHARAMTNIAGMLEGIGFRYQKKLETEFNNLGQAKVREELVNYARQIEEHENPESSRVMVGIGRGESFSERGGESNIGHGKEAQYSRPRYEYFKREGIRESESVPRTLEEQETKTKELKQFSGFGAIDKIRAINTPAAKVTASAMEDFYNKQRSYEGSLVTPAQELVGKGISITNLPEWLRMDNARNQHVLQYMNDLRDRGSSSIKLNPEEQGLYDAWRKQLVDVMKQKNDLGIPTWGKDGKPRPGGFDPNYVPQVMSLRVAKILTENPASQEAVKLKQDFINHQLRVEGLTPEQAVRNFKTMMEAYSGRQKTDIASQYGPIDKAEGIGIPPSWRTNNLMELTTRYYRRVARRFAYFQAIENNPEVRASLGIKLDPKTGEPTQEIAGIEPITGNETVQAVLRNIQGQSSSQEMHRESVAGVVRATMMGFQTGSLDLTSNFTLGLQHLTLPQAAKAIVSSASNFKTNLAESFAAGVNRKNFGTLETNTAGQGEFVSVLHRFRDVVNTIQGRSMFEQLGRGLSFGVGKFAAIDGFLAAQKGKLDVQRRAFLDDFIPDWQSYLKQGELPPEAIQEAASRYVESVQGSYTYKGLPVIAVEGSFAPWLSLARWNIEKANNFTKYVINPALKGNYWPLINSTVGMFLGGAAVSSLRTLYGGHKDKAPSYEELNQAMSDGGKVFGPTAYKMAALAEASGVGGLYGSIARSLGDIAFKNKPQGFTNPLINSLVNSYDYLTDAIQAFEDGDLTLGVDTLSQIIEDNVQTYRIAINQAVQAGASGTEEKGAELERQNLSRDVKTFNNLHGYPVNAPTNDKKNIFANQDISTFKETPSIETAQKTLINDIIPRLSPLAQSNPELFMRRLSSLKQGSSEPLPSPTTSPMQFQRFISSLPVNERQRVLDAYARRRMLSSAKSGMVP